LGALEGGHACLFSSGLAAIGAVLNLLRPKVLIWCDGYDGTRVQFEHFAKISGMQLKLNNMDDPKLFNGSEEGLKFWDSITANHVIYLETPRNPKCLLQDIKKISELAHERKAKVVVDSTFATPILQRPLDLGADFVLHSCTKMLGGHSDLLAGVVVTNDVSQGWSLNTLRTTLGSVPGNLESFLLLRSLRTIELRIRRQSKTAAKIAKFLYKHDKVAKVYNPIIQSKEYRKNNKNSGESNGSDPITSLLHSQMKPPYSPPCFSFELKPKLQAEQFSKHLKLFIDATSLGSVESTIEWSCRHHGSHSRSLLRVSIGVESAKDLIADLKYAFDQLQYSDK